MRCYVGPRHTSTDVKILFSICGLWLLLATMVVVCYARAVTVVHPMVYIFSVVNNKSRKTFFKTPSRNVNPPKIYTGVSRQIDFLREKYSTEKKIKFCRRLVFGLFVIFFCSFSFSLQTAATFR